MMKSGSSPYQAAIGSFYAGGTGSKGAQDIRKYSNLYSQTMNRASDIESRNAMQGSSGVPI
jgi:hypothetical protein